MLLSNVSPVWASLFTCIAGTPLAIVQHNKPIVDLRYSQYQGSSLSSGINQYLGMRFAAPPTGNLRFRALVNLASTVGLQIATNVGLPF